MEDEFVRRNPQHTKFTSLADAQAAWEREVENHENLREHYAKMVAHLERMTREWARHTNATFNSGYAAAMEDVAATKEASR